MPWLLTLQCANVQRMVLRRDPLRLGLSNVEERKIELQQVSAEQAAPEPHQQPGSLSGGQLGEHGLLEIQREIADQRHPTHL